VAEKNYQLPLSRAREAILAQCDWMKKERPAPAAHAADRALQSGLNLSAQARTFSVCFGCQTCTTVCPVVANYENPQEALGSCPTRSCMPRGWG